MFFPPQLKRFFTSPTSALALCLFLFLLVLYVSNISPTYPLHVLKDAFQGSELDEASAGHSGDDSYGYPPKLKPVQKTPSRLDLSPLSALYIPHFPEGRLPEVFDYTHLHPLGKRLHEFLERPGFDLMRAKTDNFAACKVESGFKVDNPEDLISGQLDGEHEFWDDLTAEDIAEKRAGIVKWFEERMGRGEEVVVTSEGITGQGRGIVMTGGNQVSLGPSSLQYLVTFSFQVLPFSLGAPNFN